MKIIAIALAAAALVSSPAVVAKERLTGEAKLAKILEGRTAGEPVRCLPYNASDNMRIVDKTAIVYGRGKTLWVNRPMNADSLDDDDILVRRSHTPQLCSLDTVHTHDRTHHFPTGFVGLNEFVPYHKVAAAE